MRNGYPSTTPFIGDRRALWVSKRMALRCTMPANYCCVPQPAGDERSTDRRYQPTMPSTTPEMSAIGERQQQQSCCPCPLLSSKEFSCQLQRRSREQYCTIWPMRLRQEEGVSLVIARQHFHGAFFASPTNTPVSRTRESRTAKLAVRQIA